MITHGNGPQVGLLALEADAYKAVSPYPLDVLGAESQGMIGYLLAQALRSELPEPTVVAVLTQVVVAADDPAFAPPDEADRPRLRPRAKHGASPRARLVDRAGRRATSAASSPRPIRARSSSSIRSSARRGRGAIVVCAGGGGIPVVADGDGCAASKP